MSILLIIAIVVAGGGTVAIADNALPGDVLYGVKVNVNEKVRAALALSAEAKADWEARRAERRLEEFEALAANGRLNAELAAQLKENFDAHADRVEARIKDFEAREDFNASADVTSNFETSLRAHEQILARITASSASTQAGINAVLVSVRDAIDVTANARVKADAKVAAGASADVQAAAEGKRGAAEAKLAEAKAFVERAKARLSATAVAEAEAKLVTAETLYVQGKARLEAKAYNEAFLIFQHVIRIAQEAQMLVELKVNVSAEVDANSNVQLDVGRPDEPGAAGQTEAEMRTEIRISF